MLRRLIYVLLIVSMSGVTSHLFPQQNPETDTIIINSINIITDTGERPAEPVNSREAIKWAHNNNLTLIRDAAPVTDNSAFLITQFQTFIPVSGYKKDRIYRLYIDFFKFEQNSIPFNTKLKIFVRDSFGNKREIAVADINCMREGKIFEAAIPFELSYTGKFDIILHEYSDRTGNWGIWDIIVTSRKLTEVEYIPPESTEKIREFEPKIFK